MGPDDVVVLADFGAMANLKRIVYPPLMMTRFFEDRFFRIDSFVSTVGFAGPERCGPAPTVVHNSDQFSFGMTMKILIELVPLEQRVSTPLDWPAPVNDEDDSYAWARDPSLWIDGQIPAPKLRPTKAAAVLNLIVESCLAPLPEDRRVTCCPSHSPLPRRCSCTRSHGP